MEKWQRGLLHKFAKLASPRFSLGSTCSNHVFSAKVYGDYSVKVAQKIVTLLELGSNPANHPMPSWWNLVDTEVSKTSAEKHVGSSPTLGTIK